MSYSPAGHRRVPFAEFVSPFGPIADTLYGAALAGAHGVARAVQAIAREVEVRRTMRAVSQLSDHTLKDIGVDRWEIERLVRRAADAPGVDYRTLR